jgi:hypothetical protein
MGNRLLTCEPIKRLLLVCVLGLGLLLALLADSWGAPKEWVPGKTYCNCSCGANDNSGYKDLSWEKVAHCKLDGKSCTYKDSTGSKTPGKLHSCMECKSDKDGDFICRPPASRGWNVLGYEIVNRPNIVLERAPNARGDDHPVKPPVR